MCVCVGGGGREALNTFFTLSRSSPKLKKLYKKFRERSNPVSTWSWHALKRKFCYPFLDAILAAARIKTVVELWKKEGGKKTMLILMVPISSPKTEREEDGEENGTHVPCRHGSTTI